LCVKLVHLIFSLIDLLLVGVTEFKLEVFGANGKRQILVVEILVIYLLHHLAGASWDWKAFFNSVVARVRDLFKGLVLGVVPWLEQVALGSSVRVSGGQKFLDLILNLLFQFG